MVDFQVQRYDFLPFPQNLLPKMDFPANYFFQIWQLLHNFIFYEEKKCFLEKGIL